MTTDDTTPDAYKVINGRTSEIAEWDWVRTRHGNRLHHLSRVDDFPQDRVFVVYDGRTTCGIKGRLMIPGLFSRVGLPRCATCCDALGIPQGEGSPKNDDDLRGWVEGRIERLHREAK